MKFSTNGPVVNPNTLQNVPMHVSRDINVYGGRGGGEMWGALANAAKIGLEMQQKVTDGKILEANAEYNRLMSEGTSALMQRKEGEALNITEDYDKLQKSVLADVRKKYGNYINFGAGQEAFNAYTMRDDASRRSGVVRYQQAQTDAYKETQYNNQLAECRNAAVEGGGSIESVGGALNRMEAVVNSRFGEYGGEKLVEQKRIAAGQIVGDAVNMAISSGDYAKAESLLSAYKGVLPTNAYIDAKTKLNKQQEIRREYTTIDDIAARCRDANGKIDLNRGRAMLETLYGRDAMRGGISDSGEYWDSFLGVETPYGRNGCVYAGVTLTAPYFRFAAEHKNETNVGNLFLAAQEEGSGAHVEKYHGQKANRGDIFVYVQSGDDASVPGNLEHVMVSDGMGGTYGNSSSAADRVDADGNEIRGNGYIVHNASEDVGNLEIAYIIRMDDMTEGARSAYDPEKMDKMMKMLEAKARSEDAQQRQAESAEYENLLQQMQNAGDFYTAYDMAINSGQPMNKVNQAVNAAAAYYNVKRDGTPRTGGGEGSGKPYNPQKDLKTLNAFNTAITMGENLTAEKWTNMRAAADAILQNGILPEETQEQIEDILNDERKWSQITAALDNGKDVEDIRDVFMNAGMSAEVALIILSRIDDRYL